MAHMPVDRIHRSAIPDTISLNSTTVYQMAITMGVDFHDNEPNPQHPGSIRLECFAAPVRGVMHEDLLSTRGHPPLYDRNTSAAICAEIAEWQQNASFPFMWIYGPSRTGKTLIAQSVAAHYEKQGLLHGTFFFSSRLNNANLFVPTLASQLSACLPEVRTHIFQAMQANPELLSKDLHKQMHILIVKPLADAFMNNPYLKKTIFMIVDGIGKCGPNAGARTGLIKALDSASCTAKSANISLIFLVTGRVESEIQLTFNRTMRGSLMKGMAFGDFAHQLSNGRYLPDRFSEVRRVHRAGRALDIPLTWPTEGDINSLVRRANNNAVYVSTVLQILKSVHRLDPRERLRNILALPMPMREIPFAHVDILYRHILSSLQEPKKGFEILRLLIMSSGPNDGHHHPYAPPLSIAVVEAILGFEVGPVLEDLLGFVTACTTDSYGALTLDPYLRDFLLDNSRSRRKFFIDVQSGHLPLARRWLNVMRNYSDCRFSIGISLGTIMAAFNKHASEADPSKEIQGDLSTLRLGPIMDCADWRSHWCATVTQEWTDFFECVKRHSQSKPEICTGFQDAYDAFMRKYEADHPMLYHYPDPMSELADWAMNIK